jgi:hypothetical protein
MRNNSMRSLRFVVKNVALAIFTAICLTQAATAQKLTSTAAPEDVESIEAIIAATYESIARAPGEAFDWDRFRSLFIPQALLIPNAEQSGGEFRVISPQGFVDWIEGVTTIGGPNDVGFAEEGYHNKIDRYGDVANVMSSYQKHYWGKTEILGRGINSFQLVWHQERWWVTGIAWDETYAAGPIPDEYGGQ